MVKKNPPIGWPTKSTVKIPKTQFGAARSKVSIKPEKFDDLILAQGVRCRVYRTMTCPNVKSIDAGEHNIDCNLCQGNEFIDIYPNCGLAYVQSQDLEKKPFAEGYSDGNTVLATFERGIELQYFTKVEFEDYTDIFWQRVKRQKGDVDVLKYKAKCVNALIDSNGKQYFSDSDFRLDANGSISWLAGRAPQFGIIYSIHYDHIATYRAIRALHVNRYGQISFQQNEIEMIKLPEQWFLAKEFLIKRTDFNGNELVPNVIRNPDEDEETV
jgi:hypothetical protein